MQQAFFQRATKYGAPNQLDFLKAVAILTMVIDHVGAFLFPESDALRAIGRVSMPLWLFAVGYNTGKLREVGKERLLAQETTLYLCTLFLLVLNLVLKGNVFPFAITLVILISRRLLLWPYMQKLCDTQPGVPVIAAILLAFPTLYFFEYGTQAFLFALLGYWVALGKDTSAVRMVALVTAPFYGMMQVVYFEFGPQWEWVTYILIGIATLLTLEVKDRPWEWLARRPGTARLVLLLTRNTLLFYMVHFTLLKVLGHFLYPPEKAWHFHFF